MASQNLEPNKTDYNILYTEISALFEEFSKSDSKKIANSLLDPYFLRVDSPEYIKQRIDSFYLNKGWKKFSNLNSLIWDTVKVPFIISGLLKFIFVISQYGMFYLLDIFTDTLKGYNSKDIGSKAIKGKCIILLFFVTLMLIINGICQNRYNWYRERSENHFIILLQTLMYEKLLKAKVCESGEEVDTSSGNDSGIDKNKTKKEDAEKLDVNNLIATDVRQARYIFWGFHEVWSSILALVINFSITGSKLHSGIYYGAAFIVLLNFLNFLITRIILICMEKMLGEKDKRIALTADVVQGIKSIKYLAWERIFEGRIQQIRRAEFKYLTIYKILDSLLGIFWNFVPTLLLYVALSVYIGQGFDLYSSNVFTIIALMNLLSWPIEIIPWGIGRILEARVSINRISRYLARDNIDPEALKRKDDEDHYSVTFENIKFSWPTLYSHKPEKNDESENMNQNLLQMKNIFYKDYDNIYKFELKINSLKLLRGEIYFLLGRVGSGKTALLKAILNELNSETYFTDSNDPTTEIKQASRATIKGRVAYVSQSVWLQDTTIKGNILMGTDMDSLWYFKCLKACELLNDLELLPCADEYVVGPNGCMLSGGQRQRLSICRAVYQNADIYLLDDIFSSLDVQVSSKIYRNLVTDLLLPMRKTVVLVTSSFQFLRPDSTIITIGDSHRVMMDKDSAEKFLKNIALNSESGSQIFMGDGKLKSNLSEAETQAKAQAQAGKEFGWVVKETQAGCIADGNLAICSESKQLEEAREEGGISKETLFTYIKAMSLPCFLAFFFTNFLAQAFKSLVSFWLKSKVTPGDTTFKFLDSMSSGFITTFSYLILAVFLSILTKNISYLLYSIISARRLFNQLMKSILFAKMVFFDKNEIGRILNRVSKDVNTLDDPLPWIFGVFLENVAVVLSFAVAIAILFPWMIIGFLFEFAIIFSIQKRYRGLNREIKRLTAINNSKVMNQVTESFAGVVTIRAFEKEEFYKQTFIRSLHETMKSTYINRLVFFWTDIRLFLSSFLLFFALSIGFVIVIIFDFQVDFSNYIMALSFSLLLAQEMNNTVIFLAELEENLISMERARQYFDNPVEMLEPPSQGIPPPKDLHIGEKNQFAIVFDKVWFTYSPEKEDKHFALKNFSLSIKIGEKIAFCGRTGSGKTSILNLLFKLYEFQEGDIFLGKSGNIRHMSVYDLRSKMAIIPQFGFLFQGSLRENLDPEGNSNDSTLADVIRSVGFSKYFQRQPQKNNSAGSELELKIENAGANLSNGEKQIINFLRILVRYNDIICLDEATSNMDPKTDLEFHEALFKFAHNKTLVVITHRLDHIDRYDKVVVMENGELVEQGPPQELRLKADGFLNKLLKKHSR